MAGDPTLYERPTSEPIDAKLFGGLGLAPLKTEGAAMPYDPGARPGPPLTGWGRLQRRLQAARDRIRYLPARLWWAVFGSEYY